MVDIRKIIITSETVFSESSVPLTPPITRVFGLAVIHNPYAGRYAEDLASLYEAGALVGERLAGDLMKLLGRPPVSYGKGALVGTAGEMEHGGACIHPKLGKPLRAAVGGGQAVIPSNVKVVACGGSLDLPLGHKDDPWSFDHFDTATLSVADAPRPDEIVIAVGISDGGRPNARCGKGPIR